jgi:hypothetical protein
MQIGINDLVRRQTARSQFSYYAGTHEALVELVKANFDHAVPGYRDGVKIVPVPPAGFYSGVVHVMEDDDLVARLTWRNRNAGEAPYVEVLMRRGVHEKAARVDIIVYRHDVLGEDASTTDEWEIVSINARVTEEPEPLTPVTMARNYLQRPGGTAAQYTAEDFARAIEYWQDKVMVMALPE